MISCYFFTISLAQTLGPAVVGHLAKVFGAVQNPAIYGKLITFTTAIGFFGSVPVWWFAGKAYCRILKEREAEKKEALLKA